MLQKNMAISIETYKKLLFPTISENGRYFRYFNYDNWLSLFSTFLYTPRMITFQFFLYPFWENMLQSGLILSFVSESLKTVFDKNYRTSFPYLSKNWGFSMNIWNIHTTEQNIRPFQKPEFRISLSRRERQTRRWFERQHLAESTDVKTFPKHPP